MNAPPSEPPLYILPQDKKRILIPRIIAYFFLGSLLYLGILLNLSLLEVFPSTKSDIKLFSLIILIILISLGFVIDFFKAQRRYLFYSRYIIFAKSRLPLQEITSLQPKQNPLDRIFRTYSLTLNQKFTIRFIPQEIQLKEYLQNLINYSHTNV